MVNIADKAQCYGCGACANACPRQCIEMKLDGEGFLYPTIDEAKCTDCGLCEKACPVGVPLPGPGDEPKVYAAWNNDPAIRQASSSGGVFTALATQVLQQGGAVFGAGFGPAHKLQHIMVEEPAALGKLRGSKYIQSDMGQAFVQAREQLQAGRSVLFTGTPCQIAGLKSFLGKEYPLLVTCDLVCHGVPSAKVFGSYLDYIRQEATVQYDSIRFRDKRIGWKRFGISIGLSGINDYYADHAKDPFFIGFISHLYLRPSCHTCRYARLPRSSDITLADFWGIGYRHPNLDDDKGTSLILVNSVIGRRLFDACRNVLTVTSCALEPAIAENPAMVRPSSPSPLREQFFRDLDAMPFPELAAEYLQPRKPKSLSARLLGKVKSIAGSLLRRSK